jgi:hypothetical protein
MKPINRPYSEVISGLQHLVREWKETHRLSDVQVAAALAQIAGPYGEAAYVELSREDKEGRPDRVPRIPLSD